VRLLSRVGIAVLLIAVTLVATALPLSVFPRTLVGVVVLVVVGIPLVVVGEALAELVQATRAWYVRAGGFASLLALLGSLWWWCSAHPVFVHLNFMG